ncbi:hypothetical protein Nepgr_002606 [Nepenthes gracilis]|uniref:Uncharacterized protein n=1 Tax=Nepenthes gracilis TaxID=150966 RepID=A0AAD3RX11_NEPGR|nr:hypothetical protein Nepgr_002606 [Nepenthes gracilis]
MILSCEPHRCIVPVDQKESMPFSFVCCPFRCMVDFHVASMETQLAVFHAGVQSYYWQLMLGNGASIRLSSVVQEDKELAGLFWWSQSNIFLLVAVEAFPNY